MAYEGELAETAKRELTLIERLQKPEAITTEQSAQIERLDSRLRRQTRRIDGVVGSEPEEAMPPKRY